MLVGPHPQRAGRIDPGALEPEVEHGHLLGRDYAGDQPRKAEGLGGLDPRPAFGTGEQQEEGREAPSRAARARVVEPVVGQPVARCAEGS